MRDRLESLLKQYVAGFEPDPNALETVSANSNVRSNALQRLPELLGDPEVLLGTMQSPAQRELLPQLEAIVALVVGYVDHLMDTVGDLIKSYGMVTEALRRHRVTADPSTASSSGCSASNYAGALRPRHRVRRRRDRAGRHRCTRALVELERELPTPAEVDAPGLWLARIDLPDTPDA